MSKIKLIIICVALILNVNTYAYNGINTEFSSLKKDSLTDYTFLIKRFKKSYKKNPNDAIKILWTIKNNNLSDYNNIDLNYKLGHVNYKLKRNDSAVYYLKKSEKLNFNLPSLDSLLLAKTYYRLSYVYGKLSQDKLYYLYLKKATLLYVKLNDKKKLLYLYNRLGNYFSAFIGKDTISLDSSLFYYRKGLKIKLAHNIKGSIYHNIGAVYLGNKIDIDSANYYFNKSLKYKLSKSTTSTLYFNKAIIAKDNNKIDSCIFYYNKSLSIAKKIKNTQLQSFIYEDLATINESLGKEKLALDYYKKFLILRDSLKDIKILERVNDIEIKYKTEKKEKENLELKQQNIEIESKRQQNRNYLIAVILVIILFSIIAFLSLKNSRKKRKLAEQEKEIEQQKNITFLKEQELTIINAMVNGQEKERKRISEDLHDNLGAVLATLKLHFENLKFNKNKKKIDQEVLFNKTEKLIDEAYLKVRRIAHAKNSGVIANQGLLTAIQIMADKISLADKIKIEVIDYGLDKRIENNKEISVFRIIQELITNTIKHSKATNATINLSLYDDNLNIIVEDNGIGFNIDKINFNNSMGIGSIKTRVNHLEGNLVIDTTPGKGCSVMINIPV